MLEVFFDTGEGGLENIGESFSFVGGEFTEDKLRVAESSADVGIIRADTEAGEIASAEGGSDGFEAVIAATGAFGAVADLAEIKVKIVADDEEVGEAKFVKMDEFLDGATGIVIEILGFDEDAVAIFSPEGAEFGLLPVEVVDFGI